MRKIPAYSAPHILDRTPYYQVEEDLLVIRQDRMYQYPTA